MGAMEESTGMMGAMEESTGMMGAMEESTGMAPVPGNHPGSDR